MALFVMAMLFVIVALPLTPPKTAVLPTPFGTPLLQATKFVHMPEVAFVQVDCATAGMVDIASPQAKAKAHRKDQRRPPPGGVPHETTKGIAHSIH